MARSATGRLLVFLCLPVSLAAGPVSYDIAYVRAPCAGDNTYIRFPDVFFPTAMPSGSDLMLLHPDGTGRADQPGRSNVQRLLCR